MNDPRTITVADRHESGRRRRAGRRLVVTTCVGVALMLGSVVRFSPAQASMQLIRWKEFSSAKETKATGGRITILEAINRSGFIVLGDGQFARLSSWLVHTTLPDARDFYSGFAMYDFEDGSSILAKVEANGPARAASVIPVSEARQTGTITFIAGTKRFKGIVGRGTGTSWTPSQGDMYTEIDATYTLTEP